jgi:PPE-repeat protein
MERFLGKNAPSLQLFWGARQRNTTFGHWAGSSAAGFLEAAFKCHHWPSLASDILHPTGAQAHATKFSEILHWQLQTSLHDFISFSDTDLKKTSTNQILLTAVGKE